ncbi:MAG: PaaI family thioesterase [Myxococcaceae bacterium]|nr:PaaI family thioesterase [Myxococcaceae bacterium]
MSTRVGLVWRAAAKEKRAMAGMTAADIEAFLARQFPGAKTPKVRHADGRRAELLLEYHPKQLRPGGTLSGPTMMTLADTAMYALVLSAIGEVPLAVTTNLSINFLRRPQPEDLVAEASMLKLGRSLAVGEVSLRSASSEEPCAHAVVTYSLPPR